MPAQRGLPGHGGGLADGSGGGRRPRRLWAQLDHLRHRQAHPPKGTRARAQALRGRDGAIAMNGLVDVVTPADRRSQYLSSGAWNDETLVDRMKRHATQHGEAVAVVDQRGERRTSYAQLDADSDRVASFLIERGVTPGEVVAVQLPSWYEGAAIGIGVLKAGAVVNPMLPIYR